MNRDHRGYLYRPGKTPWQRFWSSPWTWLAFALFFTFNTDYRHLGWNANLFNAALALYAWVRFYHYADRRWGKPA